MKNLEDRIVEAEGALTEAKTSGDASREARAEARLETLREAKEFHQGELNRVAGSTRKEGREARENELAQELGVSIEEAKQRLADYQAIQDATETETERERKAREKAEADLEASQERETNALKLADERAKKAELKVALIDAGARKDKLSKLLREADLSSVEVEGEEVKGIDSVVEKLKTDEADWFGSQHRRLPNTPEGFGGSNKNAGQSYADMKYGARKTANN